MPPAFWASDQMRDALDSWHIGGVIAAYRNHPSRGRPLSQELVAGWVDITQAQLSRIENGPPIKNLDKLIFWAQTLRIPAHLLWFKLPRQRASAPVPHEDRKPTANTLQGPFGKEQDGILGLSSLLSSLTADRLRPLDSRLEGAHIGVAALEGMSLSETTELLLKLFLQLDDELGGDALYLPLSRYVGRLAVNVKEDASDGLAAFGQLAQMTGWLALDSNQHAAARRHLTTAVYVAHEADEPALAASSLAYMSLQETYRARTAPAMSLAQTAFTVGNGRLTPLTKTMLGTRLARAHAGLGQRSECLRMLDQVRALFSNSGQQEEPLWISYMDNIEVAAHSTFALLACVPGPSWA
jgi:hypothetical protein